MGDYQSPIEIFTSDLRRGKILQPYVTLSEELRYLFLRIRKRDFFFFVNIFKNILSLFSRNRQSIILVFNAPLEKLRPKTGAKFDSLLKFSVGPRAGPSGPARAKKPAGRPGPITLGPTSGRAILGPGRFGLARERPGPRSARAYLGPARSETGPGPKSPGQPAGRLVFKQIIWFEKIHQYNRIFFQEITFIIFVDQLRILN